jgi:hypothetical protein
MISCTGGCKFTPNQAALSFDTISVATQYPFLGQYYNQCFYQDGNSLMLACYNYKLHEIDVFNFTERKADRVIPLQSEGSDGVPSVSCFVMDSSSIIVRGIQYFAYLSAEGRLLRKKKDGNLVDSVDMKQYSFSIQGITSNFDFYMNHFQESDFLYYPVHPVFDGEGDVLTNYSIGARINLSNDSIDFLPVKYPEVLKDGMSRYGNMACARIHDAGDVLTYNFPCRSNVYVFNKRTHETKEYNPQSRYTQNIAPPMRGNENVKEKFIYEFTALRFGTVYYSSVHRVYFRIHHREKKHFSDKRRNSYLMIMDEGMNPVAEYLLPPSFSENYFVHEGYICFYTDNDNDDTMHLGIIDIGKIC